VYVASVLADAGRSHAGSGSGGGPAPWVRQRPDGTLELVGDDLRELFFADCDEETYRAALARAATQDAAALTAPVTVPAWRTVPSTYVVCAEDRAVPPDFQRAEAGKAGAVLEVATGHHPFLARPELFAAALLSALDRGNAD
jgi:pimeloyl-ACP methyl ester carboxylesterase